MRLNARGRVYSLFCCLPVYTSQEKTKRDGHDTENCFWSSSYRSSASRTCVRALFAAPRAVRVASPVSHVPPHPAHLIGTIHIAHVVGVVGAIVMGGGCLFVVVGGYPISLPPPLRRR